MSVRLARLAMATRFELIIEDHGDDSLLLAAGEEALDEISCCEQLLNVHRTDGELQRINQGAAHGPMRADSRVLQFIIQAQQLAELTRGTCDIAVGPLLDLWRIQRTDDQQNYQPTESALTTAMSLVDVRKQVTVDLVEGTVAFAHPGVRLDPGALGKGWAIERALTLLREQGITQALLHGGTSSVAAIGAPPHQLAWHIGIADPKTSQIIATASLNNNSLSVSALHGRQLITGGQIHGHIIDPRSGFPVSHTALSAIVHHSSLIAEAWSTATLVDRLILEKNTEATLAPTSTLLVNCEKISHEHCAISGSDFSHTVPTT